MKKGSIALVQWACECLAFLVLFLPGVYLWRHWDWADAINKEFVSMQTPVSFWTVARANAPWLGLLVLLLGGACVVSMAFVLLKGHRRRIARVLAHPLGGLVRVALLGIVIYISELSQAVNENGWEAQSSLFYWIYLLLMVAAIAACALRGILLIRAQLKNTQQQDN